MGESIQSLFVRAAKGGKNVLVRGVELGETGMRVSVEAGRIAMDLSVQAVAAAKWAGVPIPDHRVERLQAWSRNQERQFHEQTAYYLGSLYLKALVQRRRGEAALVEPDKVLELLGDFSEQTHVDVEAVMDPHAGSVVKAMLKQRTDEID